MVQMTLGIRFFSYSFSFFKGNGLYLLRKTKYSLTFCTNLHANEPMYKKAKEVQNSDMYDFKAKLWGMPS